MIKDLRDWKKESERKNKNKHQWGWFQHLNAGNVEYNIDFFNHVTGADGGDTSVLAGSVSDGGMGESLSMNDTVELYYDDIEVSGYYGPTDWETGYPEKEYNETVSWVYTVDRDDIFVDLEEFIAEESPELSDGQLEMIVSENFEELVDKYYQQLLDKYRKYAEEEANEKYEYDEYDHYLDAIGESVNIREALNKIDCNTCGKYDLLNMYDCSDMPVEKKAKLAEMLKENVSADKLYEYMDEESPWQIGLELFADNGKEYKVVSVIDEREVDGYELSIVGAIGNELSNADEEVYFVLLDSDIEWGPVDTAEEAIEWASDVRDGYYSDDEDDFDSDDDYTGYDESLVTEAPDMFGLPTDDELEVEYQKRKDRVAKQREKAQAKYDSAKSLPVSKIIDKSSNSFTKDAAIKRALLDIGASYGLSIKQTFNNYYTTYSNMLTLVSMENDNIPLYTVRAEVGFGVSNFNGRPYIEAHIRVGNYARHSNIVDLSIDPLDESITIGDLFELVSDRSKDIANKFDKIMKHAQSLSSNDSDVNKHYYRYEHGQELNDFLSALYKEYKVEERLTPFNVNGIKESEEDGLEDTAQEYTSANTSINSTKLPAIFSMVSFKPETINLDYGGGKFDNATNELSSKGVTNLIYDPYNRSAGHNKNVIDTIRKNGGADTATCSNVLNVIKEPEARRAVIKNIYSLLKADGTAYFTVYEGTGKGNEGPTKSGYQLNKKTADYVDEISSIFPSVNRRGKLIVASKGASVSEGFEGDDWSDTKETGGEPTYCPDCGVRFVRDEEGNAVCPECKRTPHQIEMDKRKNESLKGKDDTFGESLDEDTIKQGKHWVNKGKAGTHGKFATKKEADAQRKAMFANGYKESIKEACRRGNDMNEGVMKEIDLEIQEAGGVDAYIEQLESQLRNISREMRFLRGQARREMKAGGAYDSVDEINDALKATEKEYNEVHKKYDYISSQQTGGVN